MEINAPGCEATSFFFFFFFLLLLLGLHNCLEVKVSILVSIANNLYDNKQVGGK